MARDLRSSTMTTIHDTAPRFAAIEIDPDWTSPFGVLSIATFALSLIVAAVVALANTNAIQRHQQATAEARLLLSRAPSMTWSAAGYADAGPFGFVEIDWDRLRAR
jgi:hypothetical protein